MKGKERVKNGCEGGIEKKSRSNRGNEMGERKRISLERF